MFVEFRGFREKVRKISRQLSIENQNHIARDYGSNPKRFWNRVNKVRRCKNNISILEVDGKELVEDKDKAEAFAGYFSSVYIKDDPFVDGDGQFNSWAHSEEMVELTIDNAVVLNKLKSLVICKSAGPDGLHPRVLRETAGSISSQLCYIFRDSLDSGVVVEDWRFGHVIPLHKKGRRTIVSNYRPISLTSVCCKILE